MKEKRQYPDSMIQFPYQGDLVSFLSGEGEPVMVNATQMAKPFGNAKRPYFWLNNQQTNEFLRTLSKARNLALDDLVRVTKGGNNPGTWFHEDVALEFARWLSPSFAIWCNDVIKMLLKRACLPNGMELRMQQLERVDDSLEALRDKLERLRSLGMSEDAPVMKSIKEELDKGDI